MIFHPLTSRAFTPPSRRSSVERRDDGDDGPACVRHPSPRRGTARTSS